MSSKDKNIEEVYSSDDVRNVFSDDDLRKIRQMRKDKRICSRAINIRKTNKINQGKNINGRQNNSSIKLFNKYMCDVYLVGGSIRNLILNIPIKDIDLATDCYPRNKINSRN